MGGGVHTSSYTVTVPPRRPLCQGYPANIYGKRRSKGKTQHTRTIQVKARQRNGDTNVLTHLIVNVLQ